jgi:hypothetical protein
MAPLLERLKILAFNAAGESFPSEPRMSAAKPEMCGLRTKKSVHDNRYKKEVGMRRKILT